MEKTRKTYIRLLIITTVKEALQEYGLTEKEAELYLATLTNGDSTSNTLAEKTPLQRTSIYDIAHTLVQKGLLSTYKKDKKIYFSAKPPQALIELLNQKKEHIKEVVPQLEQLYKQANTKTHITIYKGKTGLRTVAKEMLVEKEILVYGGGIKADEAFGVFNENFARKRVEKKILLKSIIGTAIPKHMQDKEILQYTQIKTHAYMNDFETTYFIYGNTLVIWDYGTELTATKIESESVAQTQKKIFAYLWRQAEE